MIALAIIFILHAVAFIDGVTVAPCEMMALTKLLANQNVRSCRSDSGYNPASTLAATDAQITALCKSDACTRALDDFKGVAPNECTVGQVHLYADIIDPLERKCGRKSNVTSGVGSVSASGSGSGPMVGDVDSQSASGSGPMVGDVDSQSASGSGLMVGDVDSQSASGSQSTIDNVDSLSASGSVAKPPTIVKPRTNAPASPRTNAPSTTPTSGGVDIPAISTFAAGVVLATMVAAIL